jgi:hypothetical protein
MKYLNTASTFYFMIQRRTIVGQEGKEINHSTAQATLSKEYQFLGCEAA